MNKKGQTEDSNLFDKNPTSIITRIIITLPRDSSNNQTHLAPCRPAPLNFSNACNDKSRPMLPTLNTIEVHQ
jgi:hypothetical protein